MEQYIPKSALVGEIEILKSEYLKHTMNKFYAKWSCGTLDNILSFIDTLEVKEVNLQSEIDRVWDNTSDNFSEDGWKEFEDIAKHFFELGMAVNQENNVMGTLEREVKIDAGGYPYINCDIEFYDYDNDIPLAKEGEKIKIIVVKGE